MAVERAKAEGLNVSSISLVSPHPGGFGCLHKRIPALVIYKFIEVLLCVCLEPIMTFASI